MDNFNMVVDSLNTLLASYAEPCTDDCEHSQCPLLRELHALQIKATLEKARLTVKPIVDRERQGEQIGGLMSMRLNAATKTEDYIILVEGVVKRLESMRQGSLWNADGYDAALSALIKELRVPAPRATGETTVEAWLPIETAPRDGTPILIADDQLVHEVRWMVSADKGAPDGGWFVGGYNGWRLTWKPSHWRQLPSPYRATLTRATVESILAELREMFPLPHDLRVALSDYGRVINAEIYRDARLIAKGKTLADCLAQVRAAAQTKAETE